MQLLMLNDRIQSISRLQSSLFKVTRLIPDVKGTSCNQRLERVSGTEHTHILRVPFRSLKGILRQWISRFDVWPYFETLTEVRKEGSRNEYERHKLQALNQCQKLVSASFSVA